jgi:hypothetical protein
LLAFAAEKKPTPGAPFPAQISAAKRVFIANAGGDQPFYEDPLFSGGRDRAYNQFYAAMEAWGRYELVGAPNDADLVIEILLTVPQIEQKVFRGQPLVIPIPYDPQFRVVIRDPKTNAMLWTFTEHAEWAELQRNRDKNFDQALAKVVSDVQGLSGSAGGSSKP